MSHILTGCPFAPTIWHEVLSWIRSTSNPRFVEDDFANWWSKAVRSTPRALRKETSPLIVLTVWWIWKHRNAAIFDNTRPSMTSLLVTIKAEARMWAEAGARGVRQLLP
jgi:hypothetical protein